MRKVSRRGVAAGRAEGKSLCARLAPSSGAQGSNGIQMPSGVLEWTSKVAVIAAMRKLLAAVWSVATHRRPFVPHLSPIPAMAEVTNNA